MCGNMAVLEHKKQPGPSKCLEQSRPIFVSLEFNLNYQTVGYWVLKTIESQLC